MKNARDIAAMVGVSVSTVGRALAQDPRISAETRERVQRAADLVGYAGNAPARIVRGGASSLIGLLLPEIGNDFYSRIAQSLSQVCGKAGYRLVLSLTNDNPAEETKHIRELVGVRAAGIILVPTAAPAQASLKLLANLPHIQLLRRLGGGGQAWFGVDDAAAYAKAVQRLVSLGHRRVGYLGGSPSLSTGAARLAAMRQAWGEAGMAEDDLLAVTDAQSRGAAREAVLRLLNLPRAPTALVSGTGNGTFGMIEAIETIGPSGADVSLVGFGDPEWFQWWRGGLSTIRPPIDALAAMCGNWFVTELRRDGQARLQLPAHSAALASAFVMRGGTLGPPRPSG